jgi:hypothetical protein
MGKMKHPQSIHVDLRALSGMSHRCSGCATTDACCCATYEVCVSAREMRAIIGVLPMAAEFCPGLKGRKGFENVFEEVERGCYAIDTHEDGLCVFAYRSEEGIRCALHTVAGRMGVPSHQVKPFACTLWPLVMQEPPHAAISICDDALRFPCNRRRRKAGDISPEIIDSITILLGSTACRQIQRASRKGIRTARVALHGPLAGEP